MAKFSTEEMGALYTYDNLAEEYIDEETLSELGRTCLTGYEIDLGSISEWRSDLEEVRKLAAQKIEDKSTPWVNASNVKYPLITVAALQFNARAYPTIINNNNIALVRVVGEDKDGSKAMRAARLSKHMSVQITEEMDGWEADMDSLLAALPTDGICFKKVYFDTTEKKNVADFVSATDLIVNDNTKSLKYAPRISMLMSLYPYEVQERINAGIFREWRDDPPEDETEQKPIEFIEQLCRADLDNDDYTEPYIVTLTKESGDVVRVVANYREEDIIKIDDKIVKINPTQYFVKYECFPDPEGGFYSKGFGMLLKPISDSVDSILNQLIDAGTLSNMGGGFLAKGFRVKSGQLRFSPGEWKKVDVSGGLLKDSIVPLPIREPSNVLFLLLGTLLEAGKEISSIQEVMTGGGGQNTPATTVLALIEQGMKVYTAIFKRIYRSMKEELNLLYDLNRLYLPEGSYLNILDDPQAIAQKDYEDESFDVRPAADPSMATDIQKAAKAQLIAPYLDHPLFNGPKIAEDLLEAAGYPNTEDYLAPPKEGPSPEEQLIMMKEAAEMEFRDRELTVKEAELGIKQEESTSKQFKQYSSALLDVAKADEIGGDNLLAATELRIIKEQGNAGRDEPGRLPELERGQ